MAALIRSVSGIFALSLFAFSIPMAAQKRSVVNLSHSPYAVMAGVNLDDIKLTKGFWSERFAVCRDSMVPYMWKILDDPDVSHCYRNFEIAAGSESGTHSGPPFHDGDFYKWFEALAAVYMQSGDPSLDSLMDAIILTINASQRPDGYIHTPVIIDWINHPDSAVEFRKRLDFETYNMGHLMTAACMHYRATGKKTLLATAIKAADFLKAFYERAPEELAQNAICPSHYMGVAELYRTTGNPEYLELAKGLIDIRSLVRDGTDHNQDRIPFREQRTAVGHAVRANYLYAGVADAVAETGDTSLLVPLLSIWEDLVMHKLYITGGCGALYDGVSPDGTSYSPFNIQQVHQAYGRPYQLPNSTAHNESCANIGSVLWSWRMLMLTGDSRYADLVERTLYNAVLPAVSLDGRRYFYTNPLRVDHDLPYTLRWSKEREEYISLCNCCPPNIVRTIAEIGNYFYTVSEGGLWFHLYGGSHLRTTLTGEQDNYNDNLKGNRPQSAGRQGNRSGSLIELEQITDYPWNGDIRIRWIKVPAAEYSLFLRIPEWADQADVSVNGKPAGIKTEAGTYAELRKKWKSSDEVRLSLPMRSKLIKAHPLVEEASNMAAVQRGPVVYCLESMDISTTIPDEGFEDIRISNILIPAGTDFREMRLSIDRTDLTALEVEAYFTGGREGNTLLYTELPEKNPGRVKLKLIPYFAWGNRGKTDMSVWLGIDY